MKFLIEQDLPSIAKDVAETHDVFTKRFDLYNDPQRQQEVAYKLLKQLNNKALENNLTTYAKLLASGKDSNSRKYYYNYLSKVKTPVTSETAELIKNLLDQHKLDYRKDTWILDPQFFKGESDINQRNKIKTVTYFTDPENQKKWKGAENILERFKNKSGQWISQLKIEKILDEINSKNQSTKEDIVPSEVSDAMDALTALGVTKNTASEFIKSVYQAGDTADMIVQKALKSMGK